MSDAGGGHAYPDSPDDERDPNFVMQFCAWCESTHRENLSVPWLHGEYLYFCGDICLSEWGEHGRAPR